MSALDGGAGPDDPLLLLAGAAALLALSGVPGLFLGWRSAWGQRLATAFVALAALVGLAGGVLLLAGRAAVALTFASPLPGRIAALGADALTGWFALPVLVVGVLGSLYGTAYWAPRRHPRHGRRLRFCYGLLLGSLLLVLLARDGATFLIAWEAMALANFFLITTEEDDAGVRRAGWIYLLYSHLSVLLLFAFFVLQEQFGGGFGFGALPASAPALGRALAAAAALAGFGLKAGVMPLHSWLPGAHGSAPSHVSAVMSGVVLKMGIYGLLRASAPASGAPLSWGGVVLALGAASAFLGVVFALSQHDLKRLLAYHSIENIGIILLGLGLALVGRALDRPEWVLLGMAGCLLHVWNHALFKSLLFLGAGAVVHATGTRDVERLGGLARRMPATAALFTLGSVAICGLPPLNGFVSELLVFLGLVRAAIGPTAAWAALPAPVLAATGALAVACFVKVVGIVFLGHSRTREAEAAREAPAAMLLPMAALATACVAIGVAPALAAPALERATAVWAGPATAGARLAVLAPLGWISTAALALAGATALVALALLPAWRRARRRQPELPTWDCGYAAGSPRLQYTASSFAQPITAMFAWLLRPHRHEPRIRGLFPVRTSFHAEVEDTVLERVLEPGSALSLRLSARLRAAPRGQLQRYIVYILAALVPLLIWAVVGAGTAP
jgi:hydrogenase-4 component B